MAKEIFLDDIVKLLIVLARVEGQKPLHFVIKTV